MKLSEGQIAAESAITRARRDVTRQIGGGLQIRAATLYKHFIA